MYWSSNLKYLQLLLAFGLFSCMSPEKDAGFETDLISLNTLVDSIFSAEGGDSLRSVTKTIWVNRGEGETKALDNYNVKNDLDKLKVYNIATPRWADFVEVSSRDSAGFTLTTYTMANERAPVRSIRFVKKDSQIESVMILSLKKTLISSQEMKINWGLGSGYSFENTSQLLFRNPSVFRMKVAY